MTDSAPPIKRKRPGSVLADPGLSPGAGLKGLDEDLAPLRARIHSEPSTRDLPNLVASHLSYLLFLTVVIIPDALLFVNPFFENFFNFFSPFGADQIRTASPFVVKVMAS